MRDGWTDIVIGSFRDVVERLAQVAPRLLAALTLVLVGWIVAALARRVILRVLRAIDLDGRLASWGVLATLNRTGLRRAPSDVIGRIAFWVLFLVGLMMSIEALEVPATAGLVAGWVRVLPSLLVALLVLVIGWLVAHFFAEAVLIFAVNAQLAGAAVMAGAVRWLVLLFAGSVALTQLHIAREMVLLVFGIAFGGAVLALALAFGLGGRDLAREALDRWLRQPAEQEADEVSHI
jgi:hypothetical protein